MKKLEKMERFDNIKTAINVGKKRERQRIIKKLKNTYGKDGQPALVIIDSDEGGITQRPGLNEVIKIIKS